MTDWMKVWRIALAAAGIALALFGLFRIFTEIPTGSLIKLAIWLVVALIVHDAVIAPGVVGLGWLLRRRVPDRARRYLQSGLIIAAPVTVIALPMIVLRGSQPASKALLLGNYAANLGLLLALIAAVTLARYLVRVARGRTRPPADRFAAASPAAGSPPSSRP